MKRFWQGADSVFRGLLVLEMAIVGLYFLGLGLACPGRPEGLISLQGGNSLTSWISSLQLVATGFLLVLSARAPEDKEEGLSGVFLVCCGTFFLFLALLSSMRPALLAADLLRGLPVALFLSLLTFRVAKPSFTALWSRYHRQSVIILAGLWLHLFGSIGLEILQACFLCNVSILEPGKAFFEMSGGTVILYGVLLFRRERDRWLASLAGA